MARDGGGGGEAPGVGRARQPVALARSPGGGDFAKATRRSPSPATIQQHDNLISNIGNCSWPQPSPIQRPPQPFCNWMPRQARAFTEGTARRLEACLLRPSPQLNHAADGEVGTNRLTSSTSLTPATHRHKPNVARAVDGERSWSPGHIYKVLLNTTTSSCTCIRLRPSLQLTSPLLQLHKDWPGR